MLAITVCLLYNNSSTSFIMNNSIFIIINGVKSMQFDSKLKIGAVIKDFRKRNGYTQEQLAELIEITPGFLGQVERDETYPNIENLTRIIHILNIDANYIFYKQEIPDSDSELLLNEINIVLRNLSYYEQEYILSMSKKLKSLRDRSK